MANQAKYGFSYWLVFTRAGDFIGCCGLQPHGEGKVYEIGIHLLPDY